jgi:ABC-type Fe3+/spermidine/putrescine transport system ATPase subunit
MNAGRIEQEAPPREIYDAPATAYASSFLGAANLVPARIEGGVARLSDGQSLVIAPGTADGPVTLALRQENVDFLDDGGLTAAVVTRVYLGSRHRYILDLAGQKISVLAPASVMLEPGGQARIGIAPDRIRILPA